MTNKIACSLLSTFKIVLYAYLLLGFGWMGFAQETFEESPFIDMELRVDSTTYSWQDNALLINGKTQLPFFYDLDNAVAEVTFILAGYADADNISLRYSNDYTLIDSVLVIDNRMRFKVKFNNLTEADFLKFIFKEDIDSSASHFYDIFLFPYTDSNLQILPSNTDFFIGEEQILEISVNNINNVIVSNKLVNEEKINYLIRKENDHLVIHLLPKHKGFYTLNVSLPLQKPRLWNQKYLFNSSPIIKRIEIKNGKLGFLNINQPEITPSEDTKTAISIQIDNDEKLTLEKTYRIEDQEEPGGALIAELFTQSSLSNGKVLSTLRTYAYHRKSEGYLFIKSNDQALFVTNFDITPRTKIKNIYIQRPGRNWEKSNKIYPGENINVRLEGEGLHKAKFTFDGTIQQQYDTLLNNENNLQFRISVPINISSNTIPIFNNNRPSGETLEVLQYQRPKTLDFVIIDIDGNDYTVSSLNKPIYYEQTITDLLIRFENSIIDYADKIHGKQFLEIGVQIRNKEGNIIELYEFDDLVICTGDNSPRADKYDKSDCSDNVINLNNYIKNKTSKLPEWAQIELDIRHRKDANDAVRYNQKVNVVLKRANSFDIDVSFPAGLLVLKFNKQSNFANFGGVSLAMMAQMSFYQPGKIAEYKPYKIGAGFIFVNAFNFSESAVLSRDVGLVVLGSIYPISREKKLTFPLYAGFGYFLQEKAPFFMLGPGIQVRF